MKYKLYYKKELIRIIEYYPELIEILEKYFKIRLISIKNYTLDDYMYYSNYIDRKKFIKNQYIIVEIDKFNIKEIYYIKNKRKKLFKILGKLKKGLKVKWEV